MAKSWKRKYYDLRNSKYKKKAGIALPTIAQIGAGLIAAPLILSNNGTTELFRIWTPGAFTRLMGHFRNQVVDRKMDVAKGIGIMALPFLVRKGLGWRKSSTRLVKAGPVAIDVL